MHMPKTKVVRTGDNASLWNYTLSPGWCSLETEILGQAIQKFGVGNWKAIIESGCLPGKSPAQLNMQTQRLLGQQSLREFTGLHLDPRVIFERNQSRQGKRKNGLLVREGVYPDAAWFKLAKVRNERRFGIPCEQYSLIQLKQAPVLEEDSATLDSLPRKVRGLHALHNRLSQLHELFFAKFGVSPESIIPHHGQATAPTYTPSTMTEMKHNSRKRTISQV